MPCLKGQELLLPELPYIPGEIAAWMVIHVVITGLAGPDYILAIPAGLKVPSAEEVEAILYRILSAERAQLAVLGHSFCPDLY